MLSQFLFRYILHNESFWQCCFSFCLGAISVGCVWCYQNLPDQLEIDPEFWIEPWNEALKKSMEWKKNIGELPHEFFASRKVKHWPWETIRRSITRQESTIYDDLGEETSTSETEDEEAKTDKETCIGGIFGMDVGGTLAKLVYFEKKPTNYHPVSPRERHYHIAASAQAVSVTRRSQQRSPVPRRRSFPNMGTSQHSGLKTDMSNHAPLHSESSEEDLRQLESMRQESVPDDLSHYRTSVHFETPERPSRRRAEGSSDTENEDNPESATETGGKMKKSRSMFDLSVKQKKAEALDQFYNFARRLDSYEHSVRDHKLSFYSRELGGEFHFIRFETRRMRDAMELIRVDNLHKHISEMGATGGGAHKYAQDWERSLGIRMDKQDELDSLVAGMQFVLSTVVGECYTFRPKQSSRSTEEEQIGAPLLDDAASEGSDDTTSGEKQKDRVDGWWWSRKVQRDAISYSSTYPYLLVTIGTGVSILRVDGPRKHQRVSGSSIGGGTYWGLIRLLTDVEDFEAVMRLAEKGDPAKVDMMVGDIYGKDSKALEKLGLPSDIVASSFGKLVAKEDPASGVKQEDLARALLLMVTNNIGQVAYLNAQLHKTSRIYFVGNFLRSNMISQRRLSYAINYWSKGKMEALFLEHEGYFGALGAFLVSQNVPNVEEGFADWDHNKHQSHHDDRRQSMRHLQAFGA